MFRRLVLCVPFLYHTTLTSEAGRILPSAILDVNNFFIMKANATKLGDFFQKKILETA